MAPQRKKTPSAKLQTKNLTSDTNLDYKFKGTVSPVWNWQKVVWLDKPWLTHQALDI
jgi:hypothetical protein